MSKPINHTLIAERKELILAYLAKHPLGVATPELQAYLHIYQVTRVLAPLRAMNLVDCWPTKGTGAKWFLVKYSGKVMDAWNARQEEKAERARAYHRLRDRATGRKHDRKDTVDYSAPRYSSIWHMGAIAQINAIAEGLLPSASNHSLISNTDRSETTPWTTPQASPAPSSSQMPRAGATNSESYSASSSVRQQSSR